MAIFSLAGLDSLPQAVLSDEFQSRSLRYKTANAERDQVHSPGNHWLVHHDIVSTCPKLY
jgi:hypothetical protein